MPDRPASERKPLNVIGPPLPVNLLYLFSTALVAAERCMAEYPVSDRKTTRCEILSPVNGLILIKRKIYLSNYFSINSWSSRFVSIDFETIN